MTGWLETLNNMNEDLCERVVNVFIKRAFGNTAEILLSKDKYTGYCTPRLLYNGNDFYLIPYDSSGRIIPGGFKPIKSLSGKLWKAVLKNMLEIAYSGGYVSYLSYRAHIVDSNVSLEEALISAELSLNNN